MSQILRDILMQIETILRWSNFLLIRQPEVRERASILE